MLENELYIIGDVDSANYLSYKNNLINGPISIIMK